jgi:multidrug efflux pump
MFLPNLSIRRPVLASMMSLALVLFGLISLTRLPVRELPDIDAPIVTVSTVYPGANAAIIETEVTERIEEAVNSVEGIRTLTSQSREQISNVTIEFDLSRDIDLATQDVRDRVARIRGRLPQDIREPVVAKQDADARPMMWIGFNSDRHTGREITRLLEDQVKNRLQTISGVSSITIGGEQRFAMRLWLDAERMAAHQVTVTDVQRALRAQNVELPSGRVENIHREFSILTRGDLKTTGEFNRLVVRTEGDRIVRLQDIGEAREGVENERTMARQNGRPCAFIGVIKQSKANTIEVARGVRAELDAIYPTLPPGIEMNYSLDEAVYVQQAITEVWETLAIAFGLVVLVVFLFLQNLRATLIPAFAIPVSIIATFILLYVLGYSVNILTMLALVLAIGIVVDDAIVVLENIYRHIEAGTPPMQAAFKAMGEISFAIIAITVALVAVFLPLAFQTSATGRLFTEFAVAVAGSVIISAFVALSLSPMMASRMIKPVHERKKNRFFLFLESGLKKLSSGYGRILRSLLGLLERILRPFLSGKPGALAGGLLFCVLLVAISLSVPTFFYRLLDQEFLPDEDKGRLFSFVVAPEGATSEYTDAMMQKVEEILLETPELEVVGIIVAPGFLGGGQANNAISFVRLKDRRDRDRGVQEIVNSPQGLRARLFNEVEGAMVMPQIPKAIGRGFGAPFEVVIQSHDLDALNVYSQELANELRQAGFLLNVRSSFELSKPELRLSIDRDRAAALGVSIEDISRSLQILFGGLDISRIKMDGKEYDVIAQLERASRLTPHHLDRLYVRGLNGELIQLSSLVTAETGPAPNAIQRFNRLRSATISGTPVGVPLGAAIERTEEILAATMPPGFRYDWAGETRDFKDAGREVWWMFILALIIVYMVLASQFESLVHPITIILAVPLAAVGAFGFLWLLNWGGQAGWLPEIGGMNFNLFSQIGLILLIGLVTKNSILLVEFANQQRALGLNPYESMVQAGMIRLRPILMTAFSTIAGILPIAIGFGAGAESRRPMGVAVIGGMITSTFLTLFVIPVVYTTFSALGDVLWRKGEVPEPEPVSPRPGMSQA